MEGVEENCATMGYGTLGAVYGLGLGFDASAAYCAQNPETGIKYCNIESGEDNLYKHSNDFYSIKEDRTMTYTTYDGKTFELQLAEQINMADFDVKNPVDNALSIAKRMALGGVNFSDMKAETLMPVSIRKGIRFYSISLLKSVAYIVA